MAQHVKVSLKKFEAESENNLNVFTYSIEHNNGTTSVEQNLEIYGGDSFFGNKWSARLSLDDFPPQNTPQEAAEKMADWLERLALAIRSGEYQKPFNSEFKEVAL